MKKTVTPFDVKEYIFRESYSLIKTPTEDVKIEKIIARLKDDSFIEGKLRRDNIKNETTITVERELPTRTYRSC